MRYLPFLRVSREGLCRCILSVAQPEGRQAAGPPPRSVATLTKEGWGKILLGILGLFLAFARCSAGQRPNEPCTCTRSYGIGIPRWRIIKAVNSKRYPILWPHSLCPPPTLTQIACKPNDRSNVAITQSCRRI
jgi:hypothetical protein